MGSWADRVLSMATDDWERSIIARIRVGDHEAFGDAYDQYAALVHGVASRLVGRDSAADITQEVFVHLWTRPDGFDPDKGRLRTYLALMARRRAIDLLRRRGRAASKEEAFAREAVQSAPNVDEAAMALVALDKVHRAIAELPSEQRRAIELAYLEGLTFKDVAARTDVAEGTAKSRLRLALTKLGRALHDERPASWA